MSEREKEIMSTIIEGFPKLSDFDQGYLLGVVESKGNEKDRKGRNLVEVSTGKTGKEC